MFEGARPVVVQLPILCIGIVLITGTKNFFCIMLPGGTLPLNEKLRSNHDAVRDNQYDSAQIKTVDCLVPFERKFYSDGPSHVVDTGGQPSAGIF